VDVTVEVGEVATPEEFYDAFFAAAAGRVPDYGGRNLDALIDDLGDVAEPITLTLAGADRAADRLGDWFDRLLGSLAVATGRSSGRVSVVLRARS
jgi:RNAse (barnase) inhibitor barstar